MVVVILLVLWAVALGPSLVRRFFEDRSEGSIDSFHHQLHLLERAGPKIVPPAYSLVTVEPTAAGRPPLPAISSMPRRPSLVLLESAHADAVDHAEENLVADGTGGQLRRVARPGGPRLATVPDGGWPTGDGSAGALAARDRDFRRRVMRRRRRDVLVGLVATLVLTGPLGLVRSLHGLWVFTVMSAVGLAVYVALAAYARSLAERGGRGRTGTRGAWSKETGAARARHHGGRGRAGALGGPEADAFLARAAPTGAQATGDPSVEAWAAGEALPRRWAAAAGYPGAWDDEPLDGAATGG